MSRNDTRLGPFEVRSPLGAGGREEVRRVGEAMFDREAAIEGLTASRASGLAVRG